MECPVCKKLILNSSTRCISCGYVYSESIQTKLSVYFDLRKELDTLKSTLKTTVWPGLQRISEKIDLLEKTLSSDLQMTATSAEKIKPEETISKPVEEAVSKSAKKEVKIVPQSAVRVPREKVSASVQKKKDSPEFEILLGQKWLLIVGIVTMVFGIGYFLKYSFDRGWIGPEGRVAMAYLWGLILLVGGNSFRKKYETFGLYVIGGGIATLYFSTFAGFQIYHLFGQIPSFFIMIMITLLACVLSVIHDTKWLAVLGLIGGFFTPVMLDIVQDNQLALMTYMTILNLGLLGIAFYKRWDLLNYLGFVFTYLLYTAWFVAYYQASRFWPSIIFLNIFYLTYSVIPFAFRSLREQGGNTGTFLMIALNSFIAFGFGYEMIRKYYSLEWVSIISIFYAIVSLLMATYLYKRGEQDRETFVMLAAKTALFLIITVPIIFSKHWITIFWATQALTLLWAGLRLERKQLLIGSYLILGLATGKFLMYDYPFVFRFDPDSWSIINAYTYLLPERLLTSAFLLLIIQRFSAMIRRVYGEAFSVFTADDSRIFSGLLGLMLFVVLNIETGSFFYVYLPAARFAAVSVLWALFSVVLMIRGFNSKSLFIRKISLALFSLTLIKVFMFDMANVGTPYRIVSFIVLGLLLVGTSYLYHRFKDRVLGNALPTGKGAETGR